jgi:homeobox protein cut-like
MVQAQRDRFKQKNAELEEELSKTYATVKSLRQEVASLQKDNLSLYEKTRYVSTYNRGAGSSAIPYGGKHNTSSIHTGADTPSGLSLGRYESAYEAQISPFAAFRGRESARAYRRMSLPERIVFSITRMVLATRTSRNLFAAYCLALHVFLFIVLYTMTTAGIEQHTVTVTPAGGALPHDLAGGGGAAGGKSDPSDWQQEGLDTAL